MFLNFTQQRAWRKSFLVPKFIIDISFQAPPAELARAVLAEVPKQVTEFYKLKGIHPNTPQPVQGMPMPTIS